ncbi:hypothetical protein JOM56_009039 [Amanita muscaria]
MDPGDTPSSAESEWTPLSIHMTPVYEHIRELMARAARAPSMPSSSVTESDTDPKLNDFSEGNGHWAFRAILFRKYVKFLYLEPVMDPDAFIFITQHLIDLANTATLLTVSFCNYTALGMKKMTKANFTITYYLNSVRRQIARAMQFVERAADELRAYREEEETSGTDGVLAFPGQDSFAFALLLETSFAWSLAPPPKLPPARLCLVSAKNRYEELDQDVYGEVKYWKQDTFNKWFQKYGKNGGPTSRGQLSKKLYFLENEDGELIENNEISAMRKALVRIFSSVKEHIPSMLKNWLKTSIEFHDMVCIEMRILFPDYFTLCENNWKAQEFVKNWFRNWNRDRAKKGNEDNDDNEKEREDNRADGSGGPSSSKRPLLEENGLQPARVTKKAKVVQSRDPFASTKIIKPTPRFKTQAAISPASALTSPGPASTGTIASPPPSTASPSSTTTGAAALLSGSTGTTALPSPSTTAPSSTTAGTAAPPSESTGTTAPPSPSMTVPFSTTAGPATPPGTAAPPSESTGTTAPPSPSMTVPFSTTAGPATPPSTGTTASPSSTTAGTAGTAGPPSESTALPSPSTTAPSSTMPASLNVNLQAPTSTSFNDSQKLKALDFEAPALTSTERPKKDHTKGKGKAAKKGGEAKANVRRARVNRNATSAQGLCKNAYLETHKGTTVDAWNAYWASIDQAEKQRWEAKSAELLAQKLKAGGEGGGEEEEEA